MTLSRADSVTSFEVSVDGTPLPIEVALRILSIRVDEDTLLPSMFTLDLGAAGDSVDSETNWIDDSVFPIGAGVEIKLGYGDTLQSLIVGEITGIEPMFSQGALPMLTVRGYDRRHRLLRGRKTRSFVEQKDSDIATTIASDAGLTVEATDSEIVHDYVLQANQTDMEFLQERARRLQFELSVEGKILRFRPTRNDQGEELTLSITEDLLEFRPRLSTMRQLTEVAVRGWNPKDKQTIVGQARAGDEVSSMGGTAAGSSLSESAFGAAPVAAREVVVSTQAEADQVARAVLNRAALDLISAEGVSIGRTDLRAGKVVKLDGLGTRFSGLYYVKAASHCYSQSSPYQTHFVAWRNAS